MDLVLLNITQASERINPTIMLWMCKGNLTVDNSERVKRFPQVEEMLVPHKTKFKGITDPFCIMSVE